MPVSAADARSLLDPASYAERGYPWETWARLRRDDPVHFVADGFDGPHWAITRHADIVSIETRPEIFRNGPKLTMTGQSDTALRMIVAMDHPEHTAHRNLANAWFMPRSIAWVKSLAEEIVHQALDAVMVRAGEVVDLQADLANLVPTAVVSAYLGAPREMWPRLIEWTETIINANDPAVSGAGGAMQAVMQASMAIMRVHGATFADRRATPRDDLMSALANARIDGRPLTDMELAGWGMILTTAGHETTQSTFGMAIHALIDHPGEMAKLKADPGLMPRAIEELLRWTSPAIHFVRTPVRDVEVAGKAIRAGEHMVMFYPSANRDEAVFEAPGTLNLARHPNRHLAFGCGPHVCLGQHLARLELRVMLEAFLARVEQIELAAPPRRVFANATGGYKTVPVRMTVKPRG